MISLAIRSTLLSGLQAVLLEVSVADPPLVTLGQASVAGLAEHSEKFASNLVVVG
jgi:hypothetical protein